MDRIVVIGAGLGGMGAAYELRADLGKSHSISMVGRFSFTPFNPWLAVGWRTPEQITLDAGRHLGGKDIAFHDTGAQYIDPELRQVHTDVGEVLDYDYLLICTGPKLAFDELPGAGPHGGYTQSVCTTPHAKQAWEAYEAFLGNPGPIVIGAGQRASCLGPAYEFSMILDADLRKRKLRDQVPITFVTSEPYIGRTSSTRCGTERPSRSTRKTFSDCSASNVSRTAGIDLQLP